ncbi:MULTISPECIES: site-2 protease family protein [unclassified Coleofasciculus]|uniref:site-2 protease family protein n=1 Tax=unclassified Coleofasciculus TaxID=2692782 RepID=UPI00187ED909|nr:MULTISPECIES: site-2 protease family protein [unclassified Coleofasciculus]MBE9129310.1 site-2 protease family protein [Coleofasciculus sp. LEGE 07081]MBE9151967.1 site-2 protease family protein [Coleofasciculus sp. LEGE 07092]
MNGSIRVGNLLGIPFYVHPSWFLILGLVTFDFGGSLSRFPELGGALPWLLGFVGALLLFASVLAHELGHSFVAIRQGIEVKSITLFLFGGLASLEKESQTPAEAFWVAIAGPAVSLMLFALFTGISLSTGIAGAIAAIVSLLAYINLVLALFNLIPGLPLDGGNILKSLVWKITGNPYKGVVFASRVGQAMGWLGIALGLLGILGVSTFGSIWTLLIGLFLLQNAGRSAQSATIQEKLTGLKAEDAVIPDSPIVSADLSLREFANNYIIGKGQWHKFLVTDEDEQLLGAITVDNLKTIPTSDWSTTPVKALTKPVDVSTIIKSDQSLLEVITLLEQGKLTQLPVVRDNGVVVGILEKASIVSLLEKKAQVNPA